MCWSGPEGTSGEPGITPEMVRKERKEKINKIEMSEIDRQIELLKELAEKSKNINKDEVISFLHRAGILDEIGEISDNYPNLKKYYEQSKS